MTRTLLVTHTMARPEVAERARRRKTPDEHIELAGRRGPAKGVEDVLSLQDRQTVEREAMQWLKRLPGQREGGRALGEVLMTDGVSLWWWIESPLWFGEASVRLSPPLPDLLTQVEAVRAAAEATSAKRIEFFADHASLASAAVRELAQGLGLSFGGRVAGRGVRDRLVAAVRPAALRRHFLRRRSSVPPVAPVPIRVLLVSHTNALRKVGDRTFDVYLGPLAEELRRRGVEARTCYVNAAADANPRATPSTTLPADGFLVEQSIADGPARRLPARLKGVMDSWEDARPALTKVWAWRGLPLPATFDDWMTRLVRRHTPSALYYGAAFEEIFAAWRPETVVVTNETGYAGRAAVLAAARRDIRSVGVQHGLIGPHHVEYMHEAAALNSSTSWKCPVPDMTVVDGTYSRTILTEHSGYPKDAVIVTGQMRYETYLARPSTVMRRTNLVLIATQPLPGSVAWTREVLGAVADLGEVVVKVHPLETPESYLRLAESHGHGIRVVRDADLGDLLSSASVLIARSSTMIIEAALAECPVISYDSGGLAEPVPFSDLGGAVRATTQQDLASLAREILGGGPMLDQLKRSRPGFIQQFAYGWREGTASRIASAILGNETPSREGTGSHQPRPRA